MSRLGFPYNNENTLNDLEKLYKMKFRNIIEMNYINERNIYMVYIGKYNNLVITDLYSPFDSDTMEEIDIYESTAPYRYAVNEIVIDRCENGFAVYTKIGEELKVIKLFDARNSEEIKPHLVFDNIDSTYDEIFKEKQIVKR